MKNPYNYTRIDSPNKLPEGKNYCILEEATYSDDGGYGDSYRSTSSYCAILVYKDEKEWREAIEEKTKGNIESKYGKTNFAPVIINKAKIVTSINVSVAA